MRRTYLRAVTLSQRLATLHQLHAHLAGPEDEFLTALQKRTEFHNGWFTPDAQQRSLAAIRDEYLDPDKLAVFLSGYDIPETTEEPRTVGLILAGNIPLVGFHDILCVYLTGHRARIKLSSKDAYVLPYLLQLLGKFDERAADYFEIIEQLTGFDAVIATGSNNSARYFEAYFGKVPHVIRRNRNAVAVLTGRETDDQLLQLGEDVFAYYGLGCRNVAHLYVPSDYDFTRLLDTFHNWRGYQNHVKWRNNFDYNHALLTLNKEPFRFNGALLIRESDQLASHIAGLYFSYYEDVPALEKKLTDRAEEIQLVVAEPGLLSVSLPVFDFGQAQRPALSDFADGVDTIAFLLTLSD